MRWTHSNAGKISVRRSTRVGATILRESVEAMLEWLDRGGTPPLVSLNPNQVTCVSNKEVLELLVRSLCKRYLAIAEEWPASD